MSSRDVFRVHRLAAAAMLILSVALPCRASQSGDASPNLVLHGTIGAGQNHTYVDVPFDVPPGVHRLSITFRYTGREQRTVLDLALFDPQRFRGASGGNKSEFTLSEADATPSYLPGAIVAGRWKLELGVPNIRPGVQAAYTAEVFFNRSVDDRSFTTQPLRSGSAWYRGDLHMHTAHSDGSCPSQTGRRVPCPVFLTVQAAVKRRLDFIAVTDHNSISQYDALRELQPYFDQLLLIPGREITTFHGHANIWGTTQYVDYRGPTINTTLRAARQLGAVASINHPQAPTGEVCMGCGWNPEPPADMNLVDAVEVANGGGGHILSGIGFWQKQLERGFRLTAVGGSDNHDALEAEAQPGSVGDPTTVVYAEQLSVDGILNGIRAGHVFVDLSGSPDRLLEMRVSGHGQNAAMGDRVDAPAGSDLGVAVHVAHCAGDTIQVLVDGARAAQLPHTSISAGDQTTALSWTSDGKRHWLEPEVLTPAGELVLVGNPVYVNFPPPQPGG